MSTKAITGKGTVLSMLVGGTPTPILQVKTWQFSGQQAKYEDISNADSPTTDGGACIVEESVPTTISAGQLSVSGIYLASDPGQAALATAFNQQTLTDFTLQLPKASGQMTKGNLFTFSAYVQDMPLPDLDYSKAATFKVALKITGLIEVTPGS